MAAYRMDVTKQYFAQLSHQIKKRSFVTKIILEMIQVKIQKTCCSGYSEAITTRDGMLNRGDKEALLGVMYKKSLR